MGTEIERKFLLADESWRGLGEATLYCQGYICSGAGRTVRVRIAGEQGYLTIKGPGDGLGRAEYEYPIPLQDARELLDTLCDRPLIEKIRHRIPHAGMVWEVDEFLGENQGLIVAEIELTHPSQEFSKPAWLGREVSGETRYYNASLVRYPFKQWPGRT